MTIFVSVWSSAAFGAACALSVYGGTYLAIGKRANRLPAGAVVPAIFLTPWWPALCAGIAAHVVGVLMTNAYSGRKSSKNITMILSVAVLGFWGMMSYTTISVAHEVKADIKRSETASWTRLAHTGPAGEFVAKHYRPCVTASESNFIPTIRGPIQASLTRPDPTVCAAATMTLARESGGNTLAQHVSLILQDLPNAIELSPATQAKLVQLMGN